MTQILLQSIFEDLKSGIQKPKHPYRYACLSSISNNAPLQRMVVIRKIDTNSILIYTDSRTTKVTDFTNNPNASLLFYDYKKMTQIILSGIITVDSSPNLKIWNSISESAKKDYTSVVTPGNSIENVDVNNYHEDKNFFCVLNFTFTSIDYLKIKRPNHVRAKFQLENTHWKGTYVTP